MNQYPSFTALKVKSSEVRFFSSTVFTTAEAVALEIR